MTIYSHQTAPTQFVQANGIRFTYRRFGKAGGAADPRVRRCVTWRLRAAVAKTLAELDAR
jgi:hypothetical protein